MWNRFFLLCIAGLLLSCQNKLPETPVPIKIAFLADVHLQDIYAEFPDADYKGILNPETGKYNTIRTMSSQLRSTRLFNENYFAFLSALDDLVEKDIKLVVLPGDFSDDGQPVHVRALRRILTEYEDNHGMQFFLTTGNHDPVGPFSQEGGKTDFLGTGGRNQQIVSDSSSINTNINALPTIVSKDIQRWGYKEIAEELSDFGFYPEKKYAYWETPFSSYDHNRYTYENALEASVLEKRTYGMVNTDMAIPDMSYLVAPVDDIWLLAIDANVYIPTKIASGKTKFSGASVGYTNLLTHKRHLITWVEKVVREAKKHGKTLIAFSHYPMVEFNDGASDEIKSLFGEEKMQSHRIPTEEVSRTFADAGIQIHFGGHMHLNDTGVFTSEKGNTLFNIQTPSLAAYPSAYKVLTLHNNEEMEIETILLDTVSNFRTLFPLYEEEHAYLKQIAIKDIWDKELLRAKTYTDFTVAHLEALIQSRFLRKDWPSGFKNQLIGLKGSDLVTLDNQEHELSQQTLEEFDDWNGMDMLMDFYKLKNADELAKKKIGTKRMEQYYKVCENLIHSADTTMSMWGQIFYRSMNGQPSDHFKVNLKKGVLERL